MKGEKSASENAWLPASHNPLFLSQSIAISIVAALGKNILSSDAIRFVHSRIPGFSFSFVAIPNGTYVLKDSKS
jgi:hypothetical protein